MRSDDPIRTMLAPASITIVGASAEPKKVNGRPLFNLLREGYKGRIYPVNPKYSEIAGLKCYPDVDSLPEPPELGVVVLPASLAARAVADIGMKGVRVVIVCSSGFGETGPEGRKLEQQLTEVAKSYGVRICGPNNLGLINAFERMPLTFSLYADQPLVAGPIALVSQSGAFGTAVAAAARNRGMGLGFFVNTGNEVDVTAVEVIDRVLDDPRIKVVVAYLEGISDGRALLATAAKALHARKPLVLVKVGRHAAGTRAVLSHTGALAGNEAVFDSLIRQFGALRARTEVQALGFAAALSASPIAPPGGVGLITQSGGAGAMMADLAEDHGIEVTVLADSTQSKLKEVLTGYAAIANPVDVTGKVVEDASILSRSLHLVLDDPGIAVAIVWLQLLHGQAEMLCELFIGCRQAAAKPFIVCWLNAPPEAVQRLRAAGLCVVESTEEAVEAAAALSVYGAAARRRAGVSFPRLTGGGVHCDAATIVPTAAAAAMLAAAGLKLVPTRFARSPEEAADCANILGFPVAIKVDSVDLPHKTEAGGVCLDLGSEAAAASAAKAVIKAAADYDRTARIDGVVVQKMAQPGVELILGIRRDPVFGPVIAVGIGGVLVEVFKDVVFAASPVSVADARFLVERLRHQALLDGVRGRPTVNRELLVEAICALSRLAVEHPEIVELDLNPVLANEEAVVAVDWLMTKDKTSGEG